MKLYVLMMLIDTPGGSYGIFTAYLVRVVDGAPSLAVLLLVVNWVYFSKRMIAAVPGFPAW